MFDFLKVSLLFATFLVLNVATTVYAGDQTLVLIKPVGIDEAYFGEVQTSLVQEGYSLNTIEENSITTIPDTETPVMIPLAERLSELVYRKIQDFQAANRPLILVAPASGEDNNIQALFTAMAMPIHGIEHVSQPMSFHKTEGWVTLDAQMDAGTPMFHIVPLPPTRVLGKWGESYPAFLQNKNTYVLNWHWSDVVSGTNNVTLINQVMATFTHEETPAQVSDNVKPAETEENHREEVLSYEPEDAWTDGEVVEEERTALAKSLESEPISAFNQFSFDYGIYHEQMGILDNYKRWARDAIETAIQLELPLPVMKAQQLIMKSNVHKNKFESLFYYGDSSKAYFELDKAKRLLLDAMVLATPSSSVDGRAIWLDRGSIVASGSPENLKKLMHSLHETGINIVYFETINAGYPIYPSKNMPQNPLIEDWDPLKVAVEEGHKLGMEVHAWVWTFAVGNERHNPIVGKDKHYAGPVLVDKGYMSEALRGPGGKLTPARQHEFWLSPASPKARSFIKSMISEIITTYDVDGVQLDYIRYPFQHSGNQFGREDVGRVRFHAETGQTIGSRGDVALKTWIAWKTAQVSSFVKEISDLLDSQDRNLKLSAAVFPMSRASRLLAIQQDWETWVQNGWVDSLSPMIYTSSKSKFESTLNSIARKTNNKAFIYPGIAIFRLDPQEILGHLEAVRRTGGMGSTLFAMAHLDEPKMYALRFGPYKERPSISPHRKPFRALVTLIENYREKFNHLQHLGELSTSSRRLISEIQGELNNMETIFKNFEQQTILPDRIALKDAHEQATRLEKTTETWLHTQKDDHPFRAHYFQEFTIQIRQILEYTMHMVEKQEPLPTISNKAS